MNKKSKHKKPKVTPIPSEKPDVVEIEKSESELQKIPESEPGIGDLGKPTGETCIPETKIGSDSEKLVISEISGDTISTVVEAKDEETPKKPKRNRGKKKKGKESDFDDNIEEKADESEEKHQDAPEVEKKEESIPFVTPTARKKKNKKGNAQDPKEEQSSTTEEVKISLQEKQTDTQECSVIPELSQSNQPEETKSKKKNKKKKKGDNDEVSSVALENILQDKPVEETTAKETEKLVEKFSVEPISQEESKDISCENVTIVSGKKKKHEKNKSSHAPKDKTVDDQSRESIIPIESVTEISNIEPVAEKDTTKENVMAASKKSSKKVDRDKVVEEKAKEIKKPTETVIESTSILQESDKCIPESAAIAAAIPLPSWDSDEFKDVPDENKNKTKNKKDIKHASKSEQKPEIAFDPVMTDEKPKTSVRLDPEVSELFESKDAAIPEHSVKSDTKSKAKIVKPVEKKRKGKHDNQQDGENTQQITDTKLSYVAITEFSELVDNPPQAPKLEPIPMESPLEIAPEVTNKPVEAISVPEKEDDVFEEFKTTSKKKKKGPKPTKSNEPCDGTKPTKDTTEVLDANIMLPPINEPIPSLVALQKSDDAPITIISLESILTANIETMSKPNDPSKILLTPETADTEKLYPKTDDPMPKSEDKLKVDTKSNKKRKKSPKPQPREEKHSESIQPPATTSEPAEDNKKRDDSTKTYVTQAYDIEISTAKPEDTEIPSCDVVPDIMQPRASSQQYSDSNNNTFIREIFPVQEIATVSPLCTERLELKHDDTSKKECDTKKEEKTDIRSKMMEVNKDMEGLRLSIERSLAELTAMESKEKETEVMFEQKQKDKADEFKKETATVDEPKNIETLVNKPIDEVIMETAIGAFAKVADKAEDFSVPTTCTSEKNTTKKNVIPLPAPPLESKPTEVLPDTSILKKQEVKTSLLSKPEELPQKIETIPETETIKVPKVEETLETETPPICPSRKDAKNKHKKKKGKQEAQSGAQPATTATVASNQPQTTEPAKTDTTETKSDKTTDSKDKKQDQQKGKQQASEISQDKAVTDADFEAIEKFEDALTSSVDDVNKTFEMIVEESKEKSDIQINITPPDDTKTPVSQPKNLLGHPDIPVPSSKRDFKKEKEKIPNEITAKVKIKDSTDIEKKQSKNTQTVIKVKDLNKLNSNEEFVYKYSFRKVFLQSSCHVCKKNLCGNRVPCGYCNLVFYCSSKHKDEDWPQHQALCFAVSTIVHLKDQKHIYGDAKNITGHDYRLIRMQTIVSCEKVLKRRLVPWEQEALLYPRICAHVPCREWKQSKLADCEGCGQISYCKENPDHLPKHHARWCKSYSLYQKLVTYQQTIGRLEPKLPTKVMEEYVVPEKINEVFAAMYEEKIDMSDIQYAALTQLATAPLTAAYCYQLYTNKTGTHRSKNFTIHVVGAELQFEADTLNKWEVFFLHIRPDVQELRVVLVNSNLNPSNLPLELLAKIKLCANCRQKRRRVVFSFQDKPYTEYQSSEDFITPDIVCAFNPSIQRASIYNGKDQWPTTAAAILKLKVPFVLTAYTLTELHKDCIRIKECVEKVYNFILEPKFNNFASVRPDRNFISDDEMPLLFKNYCVAVLCG